MKIKLLIIGKRPPPIGGVTIHVDRLLDFLEQQGVNFTFISLSFKSLIRVLHSILNTEVCHLHASNIYLQLLIAIWCKIFNKILIITFHGDISRYNLFRNRVVRFLIQLIDYPILLNKGSYEIAKNLNHRSVLFSSFIPPLSVEDLPAEILNRIMHFRENFKKVFCTSATGITFDKNGKEIYGVLSLINSFKKVNDYGLVISDSSSQYFNYIKTNNIEISDNIIFISQPHSMFEILKLCDGLIRNTSTDGDSIAIKESLFLGKLTMATDVVSRPKGVLLYNRDDFTALESYFNYNSHQESVNDGSLQVLNLYKNIK